METVKKMYEICDGKVGCSYCRSYVWADNDREAEAVYKKRNPLSKVYSIRVLFYASEASFATEIDDEGFKR